MTKHLLRVIVVVAIVAIASTRAFAQAPTEEVEYYGRDAIGSIRVVFDANGTIVGRMDYAPFGTELRSAQNIPPPRFAGLVRDGEAGLDYAQARSYQVRTGRFNAPDTVQNGLDDPQRWNRYSYAGSSPLSFVDPQGLTKKFTSQNEPLCKTFPELCIGVAPEPRGVPTDIGMMGWPGSSSGWDDIDFSGGGGGGWVPPQQPGPADPDPPGPQDPPGPKDPPGPPGPNPQRPAPPKRVVDRDWMRCWSDNASFARHSANASLLDVFGVDAPSWVRAPGVPHTPSKAAAWVAGLSSAVAKNAGLVTWRDAAVAFATEGGWVGSVGPGGTLFAATVNTGVSAVLGWGAFKVGTVVGSAAYATGQTLAGNCR